MTTGTHPVLGRGVRLLLALFAVMPAALVAGIVLHLAPPEGLTPLAQRPPWATWALIGAWPTMAAALAAVARRESQLWRGGLGLAAGLLVAAAVAGLWHGHAVFGPTTLALLGLAGATAALALGLGEPRPERPRAPKAKASAEGSGTSISVALAASMIKGGADGMEGPGAPHAPRAPRAPRAFLRLRRIGAHLSRHAGFGIASLLMVESFRLAHVVAVDPHRGVGMVGMLLTFFLVLPAVSLTAWMRTTPLLLLALAGGAFAALAGVSGVPQAGVAAALIAGLIARLWLQPVTDASADDVEEVPA